MHEIDFLPELILATGALGTAAFGVVQCLKWTQLGIAGFRRLEQTLGPLLPQLKKAYGDQVLDMLKSQYRGDRGAGVLPDTLRQGVRIGLTEDNAGELASHLETVDAEQLTAIAKKVFEGDELGDKEKDLLARAEIAVDARIAAGLAHAESSYTSAARAAASVVALVVALGVSQGLPGDAADNLLWGLVIGLAAVPLAPIAKDLAAAVQEATKALRARR